MKLAAASCRFTRWIFMAVLLSLTGNWISAAVVTLDEKIELQRIDGFGGFGAKKVPWSAPPLFDDAFVNLLINDLGLTILRVEVPTNFEYVPASGRKNEKGYWDGEVGALNLDGFNINKVVEGHHQPLSSQIPYIITMKKEAERRKEPLKLIASIWSPPPWMKYVNSISGHDHTWNRLSDGTHAHPNYYPKFSEYCEAYVRVIKRECGVDVYALSLQNEPAFAQPYQSCVYSPEQLREVIKVVGKRFKDAGITTKIFGPEDVSVLFRIKNYINTACDDLLAREYLNILAVHGYGDDGVKANDTGSNQWEETFQMARKFNKPLWMTETSGYGDNWSGAMKLAQAVHSALKFGKVSAWVWWSLSDEQKSSEFALLIDGRPTSRYYVSKNYYRYVRPGAVQIESRSDDADVLATVFKHPEQETLTLVLINKATTLKAVKLNGGNLPKEFQIYQTTSTENCASKGAVSGGSVTLPPESVTTLVGANYKTTVAAGPPAIAVQPRDTAASEGESAAFSVEPRGAFPWEARFQWMKDGQAIPGATLPSYTWNGVWAADAGTKFTVEISNEKGSVSSAAAKLEVKPFAGVLIARATASPAVDASGETGWERAKAYEISRVVFGTVAGKTDLSGTVRALWDDQNLYLRYDITDDIKHSEVPLSAGSYNNDSVELYLDGDNSKSSTYDEDDFQFVFVRGLTECEEVKHKKTQNVAVASRDTAGGYRMDIKIPWATVGIAPKAGRFMGIDAHVNDNDDGKTRKSKMAWHAEKDNVWESPSRMGTAKLAGE